MQFSMHLTENDSCIVDAVHGSQYFKWEAIKELAENIIRKIDDRVLKRKSIHITLIEKQWIK